MADEPRYMRNKWTSQVGKLLPCEGDFHTVYVEPEPGHESMPARWPRGDCVEVHERRTWFVCDVCKACTYVDDYDARDGTEASAPEGWKKVNMYNVDMKPSWVWNCPKDTCQPMVGYKASEFRMPHEMTKEERCAFEGAMDASTRSYWNWLKDMNERQQPMRSITHQEMEESVGLWKTKEDLVDETKQKEIAFIANLEAQSSPRVRNVVNGQCAVVCGIKDGFVYSLDPFIDGERGDLGECMWPIDDCRVILDDVPKDEQERTRRNPKKPEINWKGMHSNCKCELKFKPLTAEEDVLLPATPPKELLSLDEIHRQESRPLEEFTKFAIPLAGIRLIKPPGFVKATDVGLPEKSILAEPHTFTNLDGPSGEEIREAIEDVRSLHEPLFYVKVPIPKRGLMEECGEIIHKKMGECAAKMGPPSPMLMEPQASPEYEKFAAELVDQTLPMLNAEATPFMEIPLPDDGKSKGKTVGDFEKWALPIIQSRFPKLSLGKPVDKDLEFAEEIERMQQEIMKTVGLPLKYLERYANSKVNPDFYGTVTIPADKEENMEQEKEFKPGDKVKAPNGAFGVVMKKGYYRGSGGVVYVRIDFGGYEDGYEQQVLTMVEKAQPKTGMLFNVGDEVTHKEEPDWGIGEIKELKRSREGFRGAKVLWQGDDSTILSVLTDLEVVTPAGEVKKVVASSLYGKMKRRGCQFLANDVVKLKTNHEHGLGIVTLSSLRTHGESVHVKWLNNGLTCHYDGLELEIETKREDDKISGVVMDDIVAAVKVLTPDVSEGDIRKKVGEYLGDLGNKAFMAGIRSGKTKLTADIMEHKIKECWEFGDKPNDKHRTGDERKVAAQVSLPEQDQGRRVAPNGQFFRRSTHTPRQLGKIIRKVPGDSYDY